MLSRTRNHQRLAQEFYREAGIDSEFDLISLDIPALIPTKKSTLASKKKFKQDQASIKSLHHEPILDLPLQKCREDEKFEDKSEKPSLGTTYEEPKLPQIDAVALIRIRQLEKIIRRPTYMTITDNKILTGSVGHATAILKRPILEGNFYLECKVTPAAPNNASLQYASSVRIGVCVFNYDVAIPLGKDESVAYRNLDGHIIHQGQSRPFGQPYAEGDVIGMGISMQPPHKYPNSKTRSQGSTLTFFKNGQVVGKFEELHQAFYSFAVSTFNFARVQMCLTEDQLQYRPKDYKPYSQVFEERIAYKSLENSAVFNCLNNTV